MVAALFLGTVGLVAINVVPANAAAVWKSGTIGSCNNDTSITTHDENHIQAQWYEDSNGAIKLIQFRAWTHHSNPIGNRDWNETADSLKGWSENVLTGSFSSPNYDIYREDSAGNTYGDWKVVTPRWGANASVTAYFTMHVPNWPDSHCTIDQSHGYGGSPYPGWIDASTG